MDHQDTHVVQGEVIVPADWSASGADVIVHVEDVSRADAPSISLGELRRRIPRLSPGTRVPFEIHIPTDRVNERASYSVRAHVNRSGSGNIEKGDLVSTQSYPVLTKGYGTQVQIYVKTV